MTIERVAGSRHTPVSVEGSQSQNQKSAWVSTCSLFQVLYSLLCIVHANLLAFRLCLKQHLQYGVFWCRVCTHCVLYTILKIQLDRTYLVPCALCSKYYIPCGSVCLVVYLEYCVLRCFLYLTISFDILCPIQVWRIHLLYNLRHISCILFLVSRVLYLIAFRCVPM